ncbi:MAG: septum formation initiator family protein [Bacteroidota bacterium]
MKILKVLSNKFLLTAVAFFVWMYFFDQNDWMSQQQRNKELMDTKDNIKYLNQEIGRMQKEYDNITTNPQKLEEFARQRYRMKHDSEDLYVIEKK